MKACYPRQDDTVNSNRGFCPTRPSSTKSSSSNNKKGSSKQSSGKMSNHCVNCGKKQAWLIKFKKCGNCHLSVCKQCTIGGQNLIICGLCQASRRSHTSTNWSFAAGQPRTNTRVITNSKVRDYLEHLVSKQLGGSPPEVSTVTSSSKPRRCEKYDKLWNNYHEKLTIAVVDLGKSLHLRPPTFLDNDGKLCAYSQPATEPAHETFVKLLGELKDSAMDLAPFEDDQTQFTNNKSLDEKETVISEVLNNSSTITGQIKATTNINNNYEEILATAILNKVVSDIGLGGGRKSLSPVISVVDSAVQTDNDGELSATGSGKYNVKSWVTTTDGFSNFSDDDISLGTSSSNWSGGDGANPPVVHQIEEHVEITYETNETDSDTSNEDESAPRMPQQQRPRKAKKTRSEPVPFPEHGVDIIDSPDELLQDEPSKKVSQVGAWEENWLFKKKKKPIMFSKMAAESVPMLVPNPSTPENDVNEDEDDDEGDKLSDMADDDFIGDYFEFPDDDNKEDYVQNLDIKWPQDIQVVTGKAARFSVTLSDSENAPPIWRSLKAKRILTPQNNKIEIKAEPPKYTLTIHNSTDKDAGEYEVIIKRDSGSEISHNFRLNVKPTEPKKVPPTFSTFPDVVKIANSMDPTEIDFHVLGYPEPVLNVFRGNDIIKSIDGKGDGRWSLKLKRDGSVVSETFAGEYIAVATNEQGTARLVFKVEDEAIVKNGVHRQGASEAEDPRSASATSQVDDDNNSNSSSSPAEETLKETSQSLVLNDTLEFEDQDDPTKRFSVAEREKMKWANPIKLEFNPYAPENLAKRIRAGRTSRDLILGAANMQDGDDDEEPVEDPFFKTDKRDFQKQSTPEPKIVLVQKPLNALPSDLGGVKLPSVKQLAQQFSPVSEKSPSDFGSKPLNPVKDFGGLRGIQLSKKFDTLPSRLPSALPKSDSLEHEEGEASTEYSKPPLVRRSASPPRTKRYTDDWIDTIPKHNVQTLTRKFFTDPPRRPQIYLPGRQTTPTPTDTSGATRRSSTSSEGSQKEEAESSQDPKPSNANVQPDVPLKRALSIPVMTFDPPTPTIVEEEPFNFEVQSEQSRDESPEKQVTTPIEPVSDYADEQQESATVPAAEAPSDLTEEIQQAAEPDSDSDKVDDASSEDEKEEALPAPIVVEEEAESATIESSPIYMLQDEIYNNSNDSQASEEPAEEILISLDATPSVTPDDLIELDEKSPESGRKSSTHSSSSTSNDEDSFVFVPPLPKTPPPPLPKTPPPKSRLSSSDETPFMLITDTNIDVASMLPSVNEGEEEGVFPEPETQDVRNESKGNIDMDLYEPQAVSFVKEPVEAQAPLHEKQELEQVPESNNNDPEIVSPIKRNDVLENLENDTPSQSEIIPSVNEGLSETDSKGEKGSTDDAEAQLEEAKRLESEALRKLTRQIVHSLTARSVSREFREGLKISKGPVNTPQNIIKISNGTCNNNTGSGDKAINNTNVSNETTTL